LRGGGPADLREVTVALTAEMLLLARLAPDLPTARRAVEAAIADGRGLEKWRQIVAAQGGDPRVIDDTARLPQAVTRRELASPGGGFVEAIDAEALGLAAMSLGAGRARVEDRIDPAVGLLLRKKVGDPVERGEPLLVIHRNAAGPDQASLEARLLGAFTIGPGPVAPAPLVIERMADPS
jgi:pyrimidine-nucleoside phosphorylase/thymidine phosphorylase